MKMLTLIIVLISFNAVAQNSDIFRIDSLPTEGVILDKGWKFHAGDNPDWAKADFDDSAWAFINPTLTVPELKEINVQNPLWLRIKLNSNALRSYALSIKQSGASEIYLNGNLIQKFGHIDTQKINTKAYNPQGNYLILNLDSSTNVLAIRYYFQKGENYNTAFNILHRLFYAKIYNNAYLPKQPFSQYLWDGFNIGVPLILFIFHFIVFLFYKPNKANLWYALWALSNVISNIFLTLADISHAINSNHIVIIAVFFGFGNIFLLFCIHRLLNQNKGRYLLAFILLFATGVCLWLLKVISFEVTDAAIAIICTLFFLYLGISAYKEGNKGGKYVVMGIVAYLIAWSFFILSLVYHWDVIYRDILFHIAVLTFPIVISILLGLEFRRNQQSLIKNLEEINNLSEEKQQILATQNETLEKQVTERTAELKASQNQLIQKEKLASLGELTAGIAHEIQNPLNFVNNFSELSVDLAKDLTDEIHKTDIDKGYVEELLTDLTSNQEKINHHGKRASSIVKGMLEHSRASTGVKELTDINKLADEYLRLSYHGLRAKDNSFNADFKTEFDENLPKIEVIPQDIGRVLLNLINNAFYAVHERNLRGLQDLAGLNTYTPSVSVSTLYVSPPLGGQEGGCIIKVKDNGTGMPESVRAKVFQPFFTTKPTGQGTGLGLSLAYDIVTKGHGGTLEVNSTEGVGSEFIIKFII